LGQRTSFLRKIVLGNGGRRINVTLPVDQDASPAVQNHSEQREISVARHLQLPTLADKPLESFH
jgi:hypothetical protein